eukprot:gb/GECG01008405.1/.p1 GENE.gb/GECG01008405.1/~~gb/GECG01008405.1/.p1  ORF type:complete len:105 (+),score=6.65 gb/GECG01008405.1/:1-315(+)
MLKKPESSETSTDTMENRSSCPNERPSSSSSNTTNSRRGLPIKAALSEFSSTLTSVRSPEENTYLSHHQASIQSTSQKPVLRGGRPPWFCLLETTAWRRQKSFF